MASLLLIIIHLFWVLDLLLREDFVSPWQGEATIRCVVRGLLIMVASLTVEHALGMWASKQLWFVDSQQEGFLGCGAQA